LFWGECDPVTSFLHIRGQILKGQVYGALSRRHAADRDNPSPFTLRVPYVYGMDSGPLSVEFAFGGKPPYSFSLAFPGKGGLSPFRREDGGDGADRPFVGTMRRRMPSRNGGFCCARMVLS
jgi:hypothetical protein